MFCERSFTFVQSKAKKMILQSFFYQSTDRGEMVVMFPMLS